MADDVQLQQRLARVETLIQQAEQLLDPELRAQVQELVEHLLDFHGAGLARMVRGTSPRAMPGGPLSTPGLATSWWPACCCCTDCIPWSWKRASAGAGQGPP